MKKLLLFFFALFSVFSFLFLSSNTVHAQYTCTIDGRVFVDNICQDGVQDCGEAGYSSGTTVAVTGQVPKTTDSTGYYSFPGLTGGTYSVALTVPGGYSATTQNPVTVGVCPGTTVNFGIVLAPTSTPVPPTPTPRAPTAFTSAATSVTSSQAVLNSLINPNGNSTDLRYRYSSVVSTPCSALGSFIDGPQNLTGSSNLSGATTEQLLTGLLSNTTYYFCVTATNIGGTTYAGVLQFTTSAGPTPTNTPTPTITPTPTPTAPTVTTSAADGITNVQAVLHSTVNPNGASTNVYYGYGTTNGVACSAQPNTLNGPTNLTGTNPLSGAATQATNFIPNLLPNTTYYFCVYATNSRGTNYNGVLPFTTLASTPTPTNTPTPTITPTPPPGTPTPTPTPSAPSITTNPPADGITNVQATLHSTVNPHDGLTSVFYAYGTSNIACGSLPSTLAGPTNLNGRSPLSGAATQATFPQNLLPNTTYYYCSYASNTYGTGWDLTVYSFTTLAAPPTVTPGGPTLTPTPTTGGPTPTNTPVPPTPTSTPIPPTPTPTTPPAPTVTTNAASGVTNVQAILNSTVNPNGYLTNVNYSWCQSGVNGCSGATLCTDPAMSNPLAGPPNLTGSSPLSGSTTQSTSPFIPDLSPNTTYYFCVYASNVNGTRYNGVLPFTTLASTPTPTNTPTPTPTPSAPTVITFPATGVTDVQANLNSLVNPNNDLTNASYAYGTTEGVACSAQENTLTGPQSLTGRTDIFPNSTLLQDLLPNTTYYFCVYATNSLGTRYGVVLTFTTLGPTPTPGGPSLTPTPTPIPCQVTTSPTVHNLAIGGQGDVTASVTSGQEAATILQIRFGAYNTAVATVSPASDSNGVPDYRTKVTAVGGGATAVWATADLSDGRTCNSIGTTDTDVNVSGPTSTPTVTPGGPTPTITPTPIPQPSCSGGLSATPDTIGAGGGTVTFELSGCTPAIPVPTYTWTTPAIGTIGAGCGSSCTYTPPSSICSPTEVIQKVTIINAGGSKTYSKNITVTPRNLVSGTVFVDSAANACASDMTLYTAGANITLYASTAHANSDGSGAYSVVDNAACGDRNAVISNITNYRVVAARFGPAATFSNTNLSSYTYGPFDLSSDHTLDWCISDLAPWFQTDKGDVRDTNLTNKIPAGKYASLDALYPGVLVSTNWPTNFGAGSASIPTKNWKVDSEYDYQKNSKNKNGTAAYSFYKNRAETTGQAILPVPGCTNGNGATCEVALTNLSTGIYEFDAGGTGSLAITGYTQSPGAHITLLVNGSVTVKSDISVPKGVSNLFILAAKGDITIDPSIGQAPADPITSTNLDGIYTAEGKITAETLGDSCVSGVSDKQLIIGGVFIANSLKPFTTGGTGSFENKRSLCLDDKNYPSVYFSLRPDFALQLSDFYKNTITRWKETAP